MRIVSSDISMQAQSFQASVQKQTKSLQIWQGDRPEETTATNNPATNDRAAGVRISLSQTAQQLTYSASSRQSHITEQAGEAEETDNQLSPELKKMKQAIEALMSWMSGRQVKIKIFDGNPHAKSGASNTPGAPAGSTNSAQSATANWGAIYREHTQYAETQSVNVGMQGSVATADGRKIDFNLSLALSRDYYNEDYVESRFGNALKDPLVINFGGKPAQLTLNNIDFDLDPNQEGNEHITQLSSGSGYLALDRDGNGRIDSGRELFGPNTGNGFSELAALDDDGNGWIDENDRAFSQLQIWQPNADGSSSLVGLAQLGIGAIYTGGVAAEFDYKTDQNQLQGKMRQAGVFLFEDGQAGSVQQIDLSV